MIKNGVGVCVHFCLRPLVPLERCADTCQNNLSDLFDVSDLHFYSSPGAQWFGSTGTRTKATREPGEGGLSLRRGKTAKPRHNYIALHNNTSQSTQQLLANPEDCIISKSTQLFFYFYTYYYPISYYYSIFCCLVF